MPMTLLVPRSKILPLVVLTVVEEVAAAEVAAVVPVVITVNLTIGFTATPGPCNF